MRSIKYQANVRDRFPVNGCVAVIRQLYYQIQLLEQEFHAVLTQLEMYRHRQQQISSDVISQLELGMAVAPPQPYTLQNSYSSCMDSPKENNSLWIHHLFPGANNHSDSQLVPNSEPLADAQNQDYDEIHPFFDSIDDGQSYIDSTW
ncbi:hypothetical protein V6N12_012821 [Hibiscus sabdariffa]|uniref:LOB domain-containing protein n=1 Tax=Hibiscus sabdariffa TaxID=183260 RepID=A0ABR2EFI0_9ROSI